LEDCASELFSHSLWLKTEASVFFQSNAREKAEIRQLLSQTLDKYHDYLKKSREIRHNKSRLREDIRHLREKIERCENEQTQVTAKEDHFDTILGDDARAPLSRDTLCLNVDDLWESKREAIRGMLAFHIRLIHDLRQMIEDEKSKIEAQKRSYTEIIDYHGHQFPNPADSRLLNQIRSEIKCWSEKLDGIESRMMDVRSKSHKLKQILAIKEADLRQEDDRVNHVLDTVNRLRTGFISRINCELHEKIGRTTEKVLAIRHKAERERKRMQLFRDRERMLLQKCRTLAAAVMDCNALHSDLSRDCLDVDKTCIIETQGMEAYEANEIRLSAELSGLFEQIHEKEVIFHSMIADTPSCAMLNPSVRHRSISSAELRLKHRISKLRKKNAALLSAAQLSHDRHRYKRDEINQISARLTYSHLEINRHVLKKSSLTPTSILTQKVHLGRERVAERIKKIQEKQEVIRRVAAVLNNDLVFEDGFRAVDSLGLRSARLTKSSALMNRLNDENEKLFEFLNAIGIEIRMWKVGGIASVLLSDWVVKITNLFQSLLKTVT
jgi:DNA-binding Lrp family transcriptional regulator